MEAWHKDNFVGEEAFVSIDFDEIFKKHDPKSMRRQKTNKI